MQFPIANHAPKRNLTLFPRHALRAHEPVLDIDRLESAETIHVEDTVGGTLHDGVHVIEDVRLGRRLVIREDLREFAAVSLDLALTHAVGADVDQSRHAPFAFIVFTIARSAFFYA